jgi:hypothetical protein
MMGDFVREAEMTAPARAADRLWWRGRRPPCVVADEVVGPDAIADLVAARFDTGALERRREAEISPLTDQLALLSVLACKRTPLSTAELAEQCRVTASGMRRAIRLATDAGAMVEVERFRYRAHPRWSPVVRRAVAVELKLRDWMRAIRQACAYRGWANASWVILAREPPAAAVDAARSAVLGLAVLLPDGTAKSMIRPAVRTDRPTHWTSIWVGEQLVAAAEREALLLSARGDSTRG